jgi:glycosyltransferase involved in cell wall biosynthesis
MLNILYAYYTEYLTSFSLISKKHVEYIRRLGLARVYEFDGRGLINFKPTVRYVLILHPWIALWDAVIGGLYSKVNESLRHRLSQYVTHSKSLYDELVGFDVCDSDAVSDWAVSLLNDADLVIVPSNYCVDVFRKCGVRKPVYRLPHGVDPEWYTTPNITVTGPRQKVSLAATLPYMYKVKTGRKMLLFWLPHSGGRKGFQEVLEVYKRLLRERDDVFLTIKTSVKDMPEVNYVKRELSELGVIHIYGWMSDYEKMLLYDSADITLLFTRGGAFELNCLESLARGTPCIAHDRGSWIDYLPEFLRVRAGERVKVLENSSIHVGYGYKVDVDDAVGKINDILDNYDDYKARVEEWRSKVLENEYRWDLIVKRLVNIVGSGG